jgi:hypothetical protein
MRSAVATFLAVLLLGVITVCPLLACPLKTDSAATNKSCCHKSHSTPAPCPPPAIQNCPYMALERGKAAPVMAQILTAALIEKSGETFVPDHVSFVQTSNPIQDSTRLFLRIRVLLI